MINATKALRRHVQRTSKFTQHILKSDQSRQFNNNFIKADDTVLGLIALSIVLLLFSSGLGIRWRTFGQTI